MTFRKFVLNLHLILGLLSGLVVLVVAITGAIWAFESEISDFLYPYRKVNAESTLYLSPSNLKKIAQPHFGDLPIQSISYPAKNRPAELAYWAPDDESHEFTKVFINPYSGSVLKVIHNEPLFFDWVIRIHTQLLLGEIGSTIVAYATLIFLILIVSGIILWWPRKRSNRSQRLLFKWKNTTLWRRKNFDLHSILGFYTTWIAIFIVITGLCWSFDWMDKSIFFISSGGKPYVSWPDPKSTSTSSNFNDSLSMEDHLFRRVLQSEPNAKAFYLYLPQKSNDPFTITSNICDKTWFESKSYYFNQYSGALLTVDDPQLYNGGQKIRSMYYDIHIGKIAGLTGQILVFATSLTVASLPITGFLIWWGRRKK